MNTNNSQQPQQPYVPPKVWTYENSKGSKMTMNRPTAGARFERTLPIGEHPLQLYSLATPNGQKAAILLEELLEAGIMEAEYDAWRIDIFEEDQFGSDFVTLNPNSKIPALRIYDDKKNDNKEQEPPLDLFESGSILLHLAERFDRFLPSDDVRKRTRTLNWLFWQMGSAPFLGGGFGHFYVYADDKQKYPVDRYTMETKRQLDVLNKHLAENQYMVGNEESDYSIADMAIFPWYGQLVLGNLYGTAHIFLNAQEDYPHVIRWAKGIQARPAVQRGLLVNSKNGVPERHSAQDFEKIMSEVNKQKELDQNGEEEKKQDNQ